MSILRRSTIFAALASVAALVAVAPTGAAAPAPVSLENSVASAMVATHGSAAASEFKMARLPEPLVESKRNNGEWAFGTTTIPIAGDAGAPHGTPKNAIFLARKSGGAWKVAIDGSSEFVAMARQAPTSVLSAEEKDLFSQTATAAVNTGLALPWSQGSAWPMGGGAHGYDGVSRPWGSLDFGGSGGSVRSAGPGRVYKSCINNGSALVTVVHNNGYRTSYYHMTSLTSLADGATVQAGTYLGLTGVALPCGGRANGAHVHFTLLSGSSYTSVHGKTIGGWTFYEGSQNYGGYAERNGVRVYPQSSGRLTNYGVS